MFNNSTNNNKTNNRFIIFTEQKKEPRYMTQKTQILAWDRHKNVAGLNWLSVCISCLHSNNVMILDRVVRKQNSIYYLMKYINIVYYYFGRTKFITIVLSSYSISGAVMVVIIWQLDLQLPVQSVPITIKVVSSNPVHGKVYSIQYYAIKIVSNLRQVRGFLWIFRFPPPIKLIFMIPYMAKFRKKHKFLWSNDLKCTKPQADCDTVF